jgi:DNA polymerase zeta
MPAVEVADSIVESGRETLEHVRFLSSSLSSAFDALCDCIQAIRVINQTKKWGGTVVYGDTDSIFVSLPGKSKAEAFRIGQDIADTITSLNPKPVKLKFEKGGLIFPCCIFA